MAVREMLNGLVPEDTYLRLKNMPGKDLNPNEWIMVNVYELVYPYAQENKKVKVERAGLRDEIKLMNEKQRQLLTEIEHYQRVDSRDLASRRERRRLQTLQPQLRQQQEGTGDRTQESLRRDQRA